MSKHKFRNKLLQSAWPKRLLMRMLFIPLLICGFEAYSTPLSYYVQSTKLDIVIRNKPLEEVLNAIKSQSDFSFVVNRSEVDLGRKVSVNVQDKTVIEVLDLALKNSGLTYDVNDKHIVIYKKEKLPDSTPTPVVQQQSDKRKIKGVVVDEVGEPVTGATIVLLNATGSNGTITNIDGEFEFQVPVGAVQIEISYIGYRKMTVDIVPSQNFYNIILVEDTQLLDEVVVVGFGVQKKETVTGAISMVQTKDLVQSPQANVSNMLAGRMPGLLAVQRSGEPGEDASTLRIRGVGTFASGDGSQDPLVMVDGIETDNFNNIDPNEIESLSILKDASSTAVYGVRGANGVILITTKRGTQGKPQISYSGNVAVNRFTDVRNTMGAYDYARLYNEGRKADAYLTGGYTPRFSDEEVEKFRTGSDPLFYPDVDWYDLMLRNNAVTTQHNVNVSGGVEQLKYFVSAGYYNQQGLFNNTEMLDGYNMQSGYERFNFRSNLDFAINKRLSIRLNIASQMETRSGNAVGDGTTRMMGSIAAANPTVTPGIVDGKIIDTGLDNPLIYFYQSGFKNQYRNNLNGSFGLKYDIPGIDGLQFTTTISYESFYSHQQRYYKPNDNLETYSILRGDNGSVIYLPLFNAGTFQFEEKYGKNRRTYVEVGFNYNRTFADDHNVTALLLYNQSRKVDPQLAYKIPNSYQGIVGRVVYDYKNRYLVEFNMGYNGTENFAEGKRFGFFPAYSLGWVASEENFFPKNSIVSFLKIRGSYGEVGNDRIGGNRFLYLPTTFLTGGVTNNGNNYNFGEVGSTYAGYSITREGNIGNPLLTWERAKKYNLGLEISLLKQKLKLTADYFREDRDNILANMNTAPVLFGGTMPAYNMGKMKNGGWDADITFRDSYRNFNYWVRANYTYAHNEIQYMDEVPPVYSYKYKTGQILDQHFGLICDGIYNTWEEVNNPNRPKSSWNNNKLQPGDLIYRDINGDGIINNDDEVPIGYSNFPEVIYGFSVGGDWNGIDFSVLFQGATNVSISNSRMFTRGFGEDSSATEALKKSWTQERYEQGLPIEYPRLSEGNVQNKHNYQNSTYWIRDASYLRLKNLEVGYTFNKGLLSKLHISSLRVFVNGSNLITWSDMIQGVDPETADGVANHEAYPVTRTYNMGLNIRF